MSSVDFHALGGIPGKSIVRNSGETYHFLMGSAPFTSTDADLSTGLQGSETNEAPSETYD